MAATPETLTYEECLVLPETEGLEEVVNGEIRKLPSNKLLHADTNVVEQDGYIHSAPELVVEGSRPQTHALSAPRN